MKASNNFIKKSDIYTGTIKKCNEFYYYQKYGESRYVPSHRICSIEVGSRHFYADVVEENALLIKVDEDNYVKVESLDGFFELFFFFIIYLFFVIC